MEVNVSITAVGGMSAKCRPDTRGPRWQHRPGVRARTHPRCPLFLPREIQSWRLAPANNRRARLLVELIDLGDEFLILAPEIVKIAIVLDQHRAIAALGRDHTRAADVVRGGGVARR